MGSFRALIRDRRRLAMVLVVLALALKALVPGGYMPGTGDTARADGAARVLAVAICADALGGSLTRNIVIPARDSSGEDPGHSGKAATPCAFGALAMASLPGADAPLLAAALAFVLALGFAPPVALRIARLAHVLPPLRGPPARA